MEGMAPLVRPQTGRLSSFRLDVKVDSSLLLPDIITDLQSIQQLDCTSLRSRTENAKQAVLDSQWPVNTATLAAGVGEALMHTVCLRSACWRKVLVHKGSVHRTRE
jgi:hypothetical protein